MTRRRIVHNVQQISASIQYANFDASCRRFSLREIIGANDERESVPASKHEAVGGGDRQTRRNERGPAYMPSGELQRCHPGPLLEKEILLRLMQTRSVLIERINKIGIKILIRLEQNFCHQQCVDQCYWICTGSLLCVDGRITKFHL